MAWKKVKVEEQRKLFINTFNAHKWDFSELCKQFGISRPTGYKWINRWKMEGDIGLIDRSRAPHTRPHAIEEFNELRILEVRLKYPKFGPKKIRAILLDTYPDIDWPCTASIGNVLARNGLTRERKLRRRLAANTSNPFNGLEPNEVWTMDFKGTLRTSDNGKIDPFTLSDSNSRFLLKCEVLQRNNFQCVWTILDRAFREFGLPQHILSDNGPPFATTGVGRLSRLAVNLIKVGVKPLWIDPGKPQQNGRHERMHGTMQSELGNPAAATITELKTKLVRFQNYYNYERPHEALCQMAPGKVYQPSMCCWNGKFYSPEYSSEYEVRKVQKNGVIDLKGTRIFIGEALVQEHVGLLQSEDGLQAYYGDVLLGVIDSKMKLSYEKIS